MLLIRDICFLKIHNCIPPTSPSCLGCKIGCYHFFQGGVGQKSRWITARVHVEFAHSESHGYVLPNLSPLPLSTHIHKTTGKIENHLK